MQVAKGEGGEGRGNEEQQRHRVSCFFYHFEYIACPMCKTFSISRNESHLCWPSLIFDVSCSVINSSLSHRSDRFFFFSKFPSLAYNITLYAFILYPFWTSSWCTYRERCWPKPGFCLTAFQFSQKFLSFFPSLFLLGGGGVTLVISFKPKQKIKKKKKLKTKQKDVARHTEREKRGFTTKQYIFVSRKAT